MHVKVIFATADLPWQAASGAKLRDMGIYRALRAHDVTLVSFPIWSQPTEPVPADVARVHPAPWPNDPLVRASIRLAATARGRQVFQEHLARVGAIDRLVGIVRDIRPDVVVLGHPLYDGFLPAVRPHVGRLIVDLWQLRSVGARQRLDTGIDLGRRARAALDLLVLARLERDVPRHADEVWFVEPHEASIYGRRYGASVRVIPNTIRVADYTSLRSIEAAPESFGFVGIYNFDPNLSAAVRLLTRVLPRVRERRPDARLVLIGRSPPASLRALVDRTAGASLLGDVPDAMAALASAGPLLAPLEAGTGTRLKILEAAASGIPVVTTRLGLAGLDFTPGEEVVLAETDEEFVSALLRLWDDLAASRAMAGRALERVERQYDNAVLDDRVDRALRGHPEPAGFTEGTP